jgi:hypothetical protein
VKKLGVEAILEFYDGFGNRGLRDIELFCSLRNISTVCNFVKDLVSREILIHDIAFLYLR